MSFSIFLQPLLMSICQTLTEAWLQTAVPAKWRLPNTLTGLWRRRRGGTQSSNSTLSGGMKHVNRHHNDLQSCSVIHSEVFLFIIHISYAFFMRFVMGIASILNILWLIPECRGPVCMHFTMTQMRSAFTLIEFGWQKLDIFEVRLSMTVLSAIQDKKIESGWLS